MNDFCLLDAEPAGQPSAPVRQRALCDNAAAMPASLPPFREPEPSASARKPQERSGETRTRLVEGAIQALAELGYAGATTPEIARRAAVTRGALQYHFTSRTDLDVAVIDHVATELNFRLDAEALAARPLQERVGVVVDTYWSTFASPTFRAALHIWLAVTNDPQLAERLRQHMQEMKSAIEKTWQVLFGDCGRTPRELSVIRHLAMGAARGFAVELIFHPGESGKAERELLKVMLLTALSPKAHTASAKPTKRVGAMAEFAPPRGRPA